MRQQRTVRIGALAVAAFVSALMPFAHALSLDDFPRENARFASEWREAWRIGNSPVELTFTIPSVRAKFRFGVAPMRVDQSVIATFANSDGEVIATVEASRPDFEDVLIAVGQRLGATTWPQTLNVRIEASGGPYWVGPCEVVEPNDEMPNVLIYLIDTLRLDRMSAYGYNRDTTPNIKAFAKDAITFTHLTPSSSWTRPSIASLLTGTYPARNGVHQHHDVMNRGLPSLAKELRKNGYRTRAWVANGNVSPSHNMGLDFQEFWLGGANSGTVDQELIDVVLDEISLLYESPWFAYVHAVGPHDPYNPPEPYFSMFQPEDNRYSIEEIKRVLDYASAGSREIGSLIRAMRGLIGMEAETTVSRNERTPLTDTTSIDDLKARYRDFYDGDIRFADLQFGRLIEELKMRGEYDNTLIVVLSDHGEEFWEHGSHGHGKTLYEELLRIPLLIKLPGNARASAVRHEVLNIADIAPTILDLLGLPSQGRFQGESFGELLEGSDALFETRFGFSTLTDARRDRNMRVVKTASQKYLHNLREGKEYWYDLVLDPFEQQPLHVPHDIDKMRSYAKWMSTLGASGLYFVITSNPKDGHVVSGSIVCPQMEDYTVQFHRGQFDVEVSGDELKYTFRMIEHPKVGVLNQLSYALIYIDTKISGEVSLTARIGGQPFPAEIARLGEHTAQGPVEGLTVPISALYVPPDSVDLSRLPEELGLFVWSVPATESIQDDELPPEVRENLEALGYLGN